MKRRRSRPLSRSNSRASRISLRTFASRRSPCAGRGSRGRIPSRSRRDRSASPETAAARRRARPRIAPRTRPRARGRAPAAPRRGPPRPRRPAETPPRAPTRPALLAPRRFHQHERVERHPHDRRREHVVERPRRAGWRARRGTRAGRRSAAGPSSRRRRARRWAGPRSENARSYAGMSVRGAQQHRHVARREAPLYTSSSTRAASSRASAARHGVTSAPAPNGSLPERLVPAFLLLVHHQQLHARVGAGLVARRLGRRREWRVSLAHTSANAAFSTSSSSARCGSWWRGARWRRVRGGVAALAEHAHVGVAEAVDRLELVADREQVVVGQQVDQLVLQGIRVLVLVHHHLLEAPAQVARPRSRFSRSRPRSSRSSKSSDERSSFSRE